MDETDLGLDVDQFAACMPGVQDLVLVDATTFTGAMKANVGPVHGDFTFTAKIVDSKPPSELTANVEGTDSLTKSTMNASITMALAPDVEATELTYQSSVNIKGRLGIVGDMILRAAGAQVINEFFKRLRARVEVPV